MSGTLIHAASSPVSTGIKKSKLSSDINK